MTPERRAKVNANYRKWWNTTHYGWTLEQYHEALATQEQACAICRAPFVCGAPQVDHDHATGKVRGLLCKACNLVLGQAKDSEATLLAAVEYLRKSRVLTIMRDPHAC